MIRGFTKPNCPRCGYDLSGQVAAWHPGHTDETPVHASCCPLTGTCSECGLTFEWRFLMRPNLLGPPWFVETRKPGRASRSSLRTLVRLLRPDRFWRDVRIEQPVIAGRLAWFVCVALVLVPAAMLALMSVQLAIVCSIRGVIEHAKIGGSLGRRIVDGLRMAWQQTDATLAAATDPDYWPAWLKVGTAIGLTFAFMLAILPHSRRVSRVRLALVGRALAYSFAWIAFMFAAACLYEPLSAWTRTRPWSLATWTAKQWRSDEYILSLAPIQITSGNWSGNSHILWLLAIALWLCTFWYFALRDGLRMQHHRIIFACCAVPALLIGALVLIVNPSNIQWSV
jgi:hypothetical protein